MTSLQQFLGISIIVNAILFAFNLYMLNLDKDHLKTMHKKDLNRIDQEHHVIRWYSRNRADVMASYKNIETLLNIFNLGERYHKRRNTTTNISPPKTDPLGHAS